MPGLGHEGNQVLLTSKRLTALTVSLFFYMLDVFVDATSAASDGTSSMEFVSVTLMLCIGSVTVIRVFKRTG
jgi:hypothetical protein